MTVHKDIHNPKFACDVHFVETKKLVKELIKKGYDKEKLIVTGIPMYDEAIKKIEKFEKIKTNSTKKNILFLTHAMYEHGMWTKGQRNLLIKKVITELSKQGDNYNITVKIHPSSEQLSDYESIIHKINKSIKIIQQGDILEYILNADVIISYSGSSSLVYALMCNKPIIICNFYDLRNDIFIDGKVTLSCKNEKEVKKTIENIEGKSFVKKEDFEKFIEEYFHKLDGKASERIGNEILKIVQNQ
jgi:surface carbohydrate biosynthesis protein